MRTSASGRLIFVYLFLATLTSKVGAASKSNVIDLEKYKQTHTIVRSCERQLTQNFESVSDFTAFHRNWSQIEIQRDINGRETAISADFLPRQNDYLKKFFNGLPGDISDELDHHVSVSSDGEFIAIARDQDIDDPLIRHTSTVLIYDVQGRLLHKLKVPGSPIERTQFLPDQHNVYVNGNVYSAITGRRLNKVTLPNIVSFGPAGVFALQIKRHKDRSGPHRNDYIFNIYSTDASQWTTTRPIARERFRRLERDTDQVLAVRLIGPQHFAVMMRMGPHKGHEFGSFDIRYYEKTRLLKVLTFPLTRSPGPIFSMTPNGDYFVISNREAMGGDQQTGIGSQAPFFFIGSLFNNSLTYVDFGELFKNWEKISVRGLKIIDSEKQQPGAADFNGYIQALLVVKNTVKFPASSPPFEHWMVTWRVKNGVANIANSHSVMNGSLIVPNAYTP